MGFDLLVMLNIVITVAVAQITNAGHSAHNEIIDQYVLFHDFIHLDTFYFNLRIVPLTCKKRDKISIAFDLYSSNHNSVP